MAAKSTLPPREPPTITPGRAIERLEARILELEKLDPKTVTGFSDPQLQALRTQINSTLADAFGRNSPDYAAFSSAAQFRQSRVIRMSDPWGGEPDPRAQAYQAQQDVAKAKPGNIALLRSAINLLRERMDHSVDSQEGVTSNVATSATSNKKIFVVHGHDEAAKLAVARFLEQLKLEPIILHEQANQGRTVIEKLEANDAVGFAIVLLTPDDDTLSPKGPAKRARQNVVLELGYFIGKLKRLRVCALKKGDVELPSDMLGIVVEEFDDRGAWKIALTRELHAAGYDVPEFFR